MPWEPGALVDKAPILVTLCEPRVGAFCSCGPQLDGEPCPRLAGFPVQARPGWDAKGWPV